MQYSAYSTVEMFETDLHLDSNRQAAISEMNNKLISILKTRDEDIWFIDVINIETVGFRSINFDPLSYDNKHYLRVWWNWDKFGQS